MNRPEHSRDEGALALARELSAGAGQGDVEAVWRLDGGRNNQVYRVDARSGRRFLLKRYFNDPRNRLGTEWRFVDAAWSRGVRSVPEPLSCNPAAHAALYGFVDGRKLSAAELSPLHIDAAIAFVLAINAPPRPLLAPASEACFSLDEHIATIERRLARLATIDPNAPHSARAREFVSRRLAPVWTTVKLRVMAKAREAGLSFDEILPPAACCLSPSDFGFHNALIDDAGRLTFLDFEYAGRDDPAKLVSDFFCQPDIPVGLKHYESFIAGIADGLELDHAARARCRILLDAYRVKWACIMLNDFLPEGEARRAFADGSDRAARCAAQLARAEANLSELPA